MANTLSRFGAATALLLSAACGGGGRVRVSMTDSPINLSSVTAIKVTIDEVRVHNDGEDRDNEGEDKTSSKISDADGDGARGRGWSVLCTGTQTFDLMQLRNGNFTGLCSGQIKDVPLGRIDKIWLDVNRVEVDFNNGAAPWITSAVNHNGTMGLKIDIDDDLHTAPGHAAEIKIDFDAANSIQVDSLGNYSFKAALRELKI